MLTSKLYIDLDSILDTRISTLAKLDSEIAGALLKSEVYWLRESDHWDLLTQGRVTQEQFDAQYAERDKELLKTSFITGIFAPLTKLIADNELAMAEGAPNKPISFEINIWPYQLEPDEMDLLINLFKYRLGVEATVTMCSVSLEQLTPTYLTDRYAGAFMYPFHQWIKLHLAELIKHNHPDFTLVVPKLFEQDVSRLTVDEKRDQVTTFRLYLLEYMDISFIDASCFSIFKPK